GAFTVASIQGLKKIRLFCFCRQTRRRSATLNVDNHDRHFGHNREPDRLGLQCNAGSGGRRKSKRTPKGGADGGAYRGDLILGLEGEEAEVLESGHLMKNVRSGGNRITSKVSRQSRLRRGRDHSNGGCLIAGNVAILPRRKFGRHHLISMRK